MLAAEKPLLQKRIDMRKQLITAKFQIIGDMNDGGEGGGPSGGGGEDAQEDEEYSERDEREVRDRGDGGSSNSELLMNRSINSRGH